VWRKEDLEEELAQVLSSRLEVQAGAGKVLGKAEKVLSVEE
jgi:hypothetical protein